VNLKPNRSNLKCTINDDYKVHFFKFIHKFLIWTKTKLSVCTWRWFLAMAHRKRSVSLFANKDPKNETGSYLCKTSERIMHARVINKLKFLKKFPLFQFVINIFQRFNLTTLSVSWLILQTPCHYTGINIYLFSCNLNSSNLWIKDKIVDKNVNVGTVKM
jgi:hypothetical protein